VAAASAPKRWSASPNSSAKAVIVHINSPGGTVAGSEELYESLIKVKAKKPMVVVVDGLAASGGYIAAMASDRIVAQQSAIVGSIGVIFQYPNVTELLKTIGVQVESIKSSPLKAAPSGYEPTSPEARAAVESIVRDSFDWFKGLVRDRRHLDDASLQKVSDGRVFTGRQAVELKLIDGLGDEQAAIDWLSKRRNIDPKTRSRDYRRAPRFMRSSVPARRRLARLLDCPVGPQRAMAEPFGEFGRRPAVERPHSLTV
jgi:protease-4